MTSDDLDPRIEAALRTAPPAAPPAMAARIMVRVDRVERARERLAESTRARRGWLAPIALFATFASEPAAAVALALLPVCLVFWLVLPGTAAKLALLVHESLAAWIAGAAGGFVARGLSLGPHGASALGGALVSALLAVSFFAFQWIAEPFRALRPSTSSRKSPPAPR
jgi:hypothetical protein